MENFHCVLFTIFSILSSFTIAAPISSEIDHVLLTHRRVVPILEAIKQASRNSRDADSPKVK